MNHTLTIPSDTKKLNQLEPFLAEVFKGHDVTETAYHNAMVVLTEAVNNAINHGNKRDPAKQVYVAAAVIEGKLQLEILDEGSGFDASALPDPLHPDNLLREGGRGVFLIRAFSETVEFENTGSGTRTKISLKTGA